MTDMPESLLGKTIADRYEIVSHINVGGMGVVYRAIQHSLDRQVAIKFIHPRLVASESSVQRFMVEARVLSRLNHPHVVSVFDFGRTPPEEGGHLYLVMEYLTGPDLADLLHEEPLLPLPRVASILLQVLDGLGEAHHLGITHRDVKPDNIILEQRRGGRDHVKLIDFGIARAHSGRRITENGTVCGTPDYMAPEQAAGAAGPGPDLYSVGVVMFQMLTGELPAPPGQTPRLGGMWVRARDPRRVAPHREIPDRLAEACLRALELEPERRFPDAQSFEDAIRDAVIESGWTDALRSWAPAGSSVAPRPSSSAPPAAPPATAPPAAAPPARRSSPGLARGSVPAPAFGSRPPSRPPLEWGLSETLPARPRALTPVLRSRWRAPAEARDLALEGFSPRQEWNAPSNVLSPTGVRSRHESVAPPPGEGMFGRSGDLAWAYEMLAADPAPPAIAFWGRAGIGRTRLAQEVAGMAERQGTLVVRVHLEPHPYGELGYRALRHILLGLTARSPAEILEDRLGDRWAQAGLRLLFSRAQVSAHPISARREAAAALSWGLWCASVRSEHGRVLLVLDDLDRLDGVSLLALQDVMRGAVVPGVTVLVTSESAKTVLLHGARERGLRGLSRQDAVRMLASLRKQAILARSDDDIEPLYVEQVAAAATAESHALPDSLEDILAFHVQSLEPLQRRALHAIAVTGGCDIETLTVLLHLPGDVRHALEPLVERRWVQMMGKHVTLRHAAMGRVAVADAQPSATTAIHKAMASQLHNRRDLLELRAFHAVHGDPDFEGFLLVEEVARTRAARGDDEGAISALSSALAAARAQEMRGDTEAATIALGVFGRKLAVSLVAVGRLDEAQGVLEEILSASDPRDTTRAAVLDQLAAIAELRGRADDAERYRREALEIAERTGDHKMAIRVRSALLAGHAGLPAPVKPAEARSPTQSEATGASSAGSSSAPPPPSSTERLRRPVLVVEDDESIRDAIQSVLQSEGHEAYGAVNGRDALDVLHRIPRPGLILLDLMMPVMNGWELLELLRADQDLASIPVVVVSAVPDRKQVTASRVLRKPVEVGTLLKVVDELCC